MRFRGLRRVLLPTTTISVESRRGVTTAGRARLRGIGGLGLRDRWQRTRRAAHVSLSIRFCLVGALFACWLAAPGTVSAQRRDSLAVAAGARVRVILHDRPVVRILGDFVGADSTRLLITDGRVGMLIDVEWKDVESISVFQRHLGGREAFGRGARVGAVVFGTIAAAGLVTAITWDARGGCDDVDYCIPATLIVLPLGYLFTVTGTVVGGTFGLLFQDHWRTVWRSR